MFDLKSPSVFGESSFTLRHKKSSTYTFSRAVRFRSHNRGDTVEFVSLPSTLAKRGTTQGFGERWKPTSSRFDSPAPGAYDIPTTFNFKLGPRYRKDSPTRERDSDMQPGPGTYDVALPIGKHAPKFTFRGRNFKTKFNESPSPNAYKPSIIVNSAFKNISFGIGDRNFFRKNTNDSPGPGSYDIKSECFKLSSK